MHITESNHSNCHQWPQSLKNSEKPTLLSTMYNICLLCLMETLKIIGEKLLQNQQQQTKNRNPSKPSVSHPPAPSRTQSKVIRINKKWLKQVNHKKSSDTEAEPKKPRSNSVGHLRPRLRCVGGHRRNSYPPVRLQSHLESVIEEDVSQL